MSFRRFVLAAFSCALAGATLAATPARPARPTPPENKSTTARPVDAPDAPGILDRQSDRELTGVNQDVTIKAGETHDGDVVCIRGHVTIDGHVNGDVTVVEGGLDAAGQARPGARELARNGHRVAVLDPDGARGQAWRASAGMLK